MCCPLSYKTLSLTHDFKRFWQEHDSSKDVGDDTALELLGNLLHVKPDECCTTTKVM